MTQKITPFLWFDGNAEEAVTFYLSLFPGKSKILSRMPGPGGKTMGLSFELAGMRFQALNGGPQYKFSPAVSFYVDCETQAEIDTLWDKILASGGKPTACGWIDDGFGLTWQIIPTALPKLLGDPDPQRAGRAMQR